MTEARCDICQTVVPGSHHDKEGNEPFSLVEHRWTAHGIPGVTRCGQCGEPVKTETLAEHLARGHDLPPPTDSQRSEREALRRQRADEELRVDLREFLEEARAFLAEARESRHLASGGSAPSPSLGFAGTVVAIVCALLLLPLAQRAVAWVLEMIALAFAFLIHAAGAKL